MAIITCNENNIADGLHQAYEEGYRQGRIDEVKNWKNKMDNFDKIFKEWIDSMRDPTPEEWDYINNYIESISHPTGINIFDLMNEEQREHDILYESTYNPDDGSM